MLNEISSLMDRILSKGATFQALTPLAQLGKITIADAPRENNIDNYRDFAWQWVEEAWMAWSDYHDQVKAWIDH